VKQHEVAQLFDQTVRKSLADCPRRNGPKQRDQPVEHLRRKEKARKEERNRTEGNQAVAVGDGARRRTHRAIARSIAT
jgi:hypothetical protein